MVKWFKQIAKQIAFCIALTIGKWLNIYTIQHITVSVILDNNSTLCQ